MTPVEASDRRRSFCARLKSERERRGMPLEAVAASTKIKGSLLDALERGDLSHWPKGIYRRSFFLAYVSAIGLPAQPTTSDFLEIFSEGHAPRSLPDAAPTVPTEPANLRLFLANGSVSPLRAKPGHDLQTRLAAAAADIAIVGLAAWLCSAVAHVNLAYAAIGLGAACYLVAAWQHVSPSLQLFVWLSGLRATRPAPATVQTFEASTLPYNFHSPVPVRPSLRGRLASVLGDGSLIREYVERLSDSQLTFKTQRRRDLASLRRQRAEAANRSTADELSM